VRTSCGHRLQVAFRPEQLQSIVERAGRQGLSRSACVRQLVALGLSVSDRSDDSPTALAGLIAAEQAVLMLAALLPDGERRRRKLAIQAAAEAEARLAALAIDEVGL